MASGALAGGAAGGLPGAAGGLLLGGMGGLLDDEEANREQALQADEIKRKEREANFTHLMDLRGAGQADRSQDLNGLTMLAGQRASAEVNARRHALLRAF
jgi:hypothetical protein